MAAKAGIYFKQPSVSGTYTVGEDITIRLSVENTGNETGWIQGYIIKDGSICVDKQGEFSPGGVLKLYGSECDINMPNKNVNVTFVARHWNGSEYVTDESKSITLTPTVAFCSQDVRVVTSDGAAVKPQIEWGDGGTSYGEETPWDASHSYKKGERYTVRVSADGYEAASKTIERTCESKFTLTLTKEEVPCSDWTTKSSCEAAGCFWYNNACHRFRPTVCSDYTDALTCVAHNCYWWLDGTCHDTEEVVGAEKWKTVSEPYWTNGKARIEYEMGNPSTEMFEGRYRYFYYGVIILDGHKLGYHGTWMDAGFKLTGQADINEGDINNYGRKVTIRLDRYDRIENTIKEWLHSITKTIPEKAVPKDTVICDFDVYDAADKKTTDLVAGVQYNIRAYLCETCKIGILKGCASGKKVSGKELKLFLFGQTAEIAKDTTNVESGYTAFFWTPSADIAGDNSIRLEFKGSPNYNASETGWKMVTVSVGKIIINVPKGIFGAIDKGYVMAYKVSKLPFIDAYMGLGIPAKSFWCETPPCTFELTVADLEIGSKYAIFPSSSISVLPYVTSKCVYEFTDKVQTIDLPVYIDPLSTVLCAFFDLTPSECAVFLMEFQDPIYAANTLSVIQHHEDIMGNAREPETLDYIMLPIVMAGSLLPMLPVGQISKYTGRLLKLGKKSAASKLFLIRNHHKMHQLIAVGDETRILKFKGFFDLDNLDEALKVLDEGIVASEATEAAKALKRASLREWVGGIIAKWKKDNPKTALEKVMDDALEHGGNVFKTQADVVVKHVDDAKGDWTKIRKIWDDTVKTADDVVYVDLHLAGKSDDVQVMHNIMRYSKDDFIKALKGKKAVVPEFANRFDEGVEFMLRHIGDETGTEVAKYRKAIKGLSDADVNNIIKNLDAVGQVNLARTIKTLKVAPERGMKYFDDVADALKGAKKFSPEERKALGAIIDTGGDEAVKHLDAKWTNIFNKLLDTEDSINNPQGRRFWDYIRGHGKTKDMMKKYGKNRFRDLPFYGKVAVFMGAFWVVNTAWKTMQDFCFALFMGEETIQWGGFGGIILNNLLYKFNEKPLQDKKDIIKTFEEFSLNRHTIHDAVTGGSSLFEPLCLVFGDIFTRFWEADTVNMWALDTTIEYLKEGINPYTGIGECSIKVRANKDGVDFWYQGSPTKWHGGAAFSWTEIKQIPVRETPEEVTVCAWKPGYLMDTHTIKIFPEDVGKTGFTAKEMELFELIPESAVSETPNPLGYQTPPDTTNLPTPIGNADPREYFGDVLHGSIRCESIPTGAGVYLDVKDAAHYKGKTDITLNHIPVGSHKIIQTFPNFNDCMVNVNVVVEPTVYARCRFSTPTCSFIPSITKPKLNEVVTFDASASTPGTGATSITYDWDWGDEKPHGTKKIDTHAYTAKGVYAVKLTVTNELGGSKVCTTNITAEVATGNIKCYCETAEYCSRNADIFVDGNKVDVTKESGYTYIKDLTPGVHTVRYNLLDVMECIDDVVVTADEEAIYEGVLALSERIKSKFSYDPTNYYYKDVKVTKIEDGDSIFTDFTNPFPKPPLFPAGQQVRIAGYDSPDGATARANAKAKLTELIPIGSSVTLKIWPPTPLGKLNRVLAGVFKGDVDIAAEMLKSCLANESPYKGKDNFPWVDWVDYGRLWKDPVGKECLTNPVVKPLITDVDTTQKTFKINNRWFTLDFTVRYEDEYGVQKGVESKMKVDGRKVSTPIAYATGTYVIKLFACIVKCDKKENWILVDTGYVAVAPTKKTVTFKSVPAGAACTVVRKETANLVRTLKRVIRI